MKPVTLLRHIPLYPSLIKFRCKKDIPSLGCGEKAIKADFRLWGIWWIIKSTNGLKLTDGSQMPCHEIYDIHGNHIIGQRDIEAAKGTPHESAWRESMIHSINTRLGITE